MAKSGRFDGLWWHAEGNGPMLLVMAGGMGFDHSYLRPWLDPLSEYFQLVYFDHRGNGNSDEPNTWDAVSIASWADDADRLRAHLGAESMVLFGHSYGGIIAQEYALRHPQRLDALILCSTYPSFAHAPVAMANAAARGTSEQVAVLVAGLSSRSESDAKFAQDCRTILPLYFHTPSPSHLAALDRVRFRANAFNHAFFACLPGLSMAELLTHVQVPTLVLNGDDDWIAPVEHGAQLLHEAIPGAELVVIEDSGHFPFVERQAAFVHVVADWTRHRSGTKTSTRSTSRL